MRHALIGFLFSLTTSVLCSQPEGKVYDDLSMYSNYLDMERHYAVYLPPDYETSKRSYPVLYLLHGAGDDHTGWIQFGEVKHIADKAIREGLATPMVIIMPDAQTGRRGYFNSIEGDFPYEDFMFEEFIPHVENRFRIKSEKRYRGIAGLSMGGGGSFMYALHHPEMFSASCPLSAYQGPLNAAQLRQSLERRGITGVDDIAIDAYLKQHSALELIRNGNPEQIGSVRWYIDCGDDDFLYEGNSLIHIAMKKKDLPHEYRVRDGGHTWTYWRESLPEVLRFVSMGFHQY